MKIDAAGWEQIRSAYEDTDETLDTMAARFEVSRSSISMRVGKHGWRRRRNGARVDAQTLVQRMYRLVEKVLMRMERSEGTMSEKDAAILTRMAATIDRLIDVQNKAPQLPRRGPAQKETEEMQQFRTAIDRRIEQLGDF